MFGLKRKRKLTTYTDITTGIYKILLFRNINGSYIQVEKIKHKVTNEKFRYNNKDFKFNAGNIAFSDEKCNYYAYDFDLGTQLSFNERNLPKNISIGELDAYVNRAVISQIIAGLEKRKEDNKGKLMLVVLAGIMGGAIGFIIGQQIAPKTQTIIAELALLIIGVFH